MDSSDQQGDATPPLDRQWSTASGDTLILPSDDEGDNFNESPLLDDDPMWSSTMEVSSTCAGDIGNLENWVLSGGYLPSSALDVVPELRRLPGCASNNRRICARNTQLRVTNDSTGRPVRTLSGLESNLAVAEWSPKKPIFGELQSGDLPKTSGGTKFSANVDGGLSCTSESQNRANQTQPKDVFEFDENDDISDTALFKIKDASVLGEFACPGIEKGAGSVEVVANAINKNLSLGECVNVEDWPETALDRNGENGLSGLEENLAVAEWSPKKRIFAELQSGDLPKTSGGTKFSAEVDGGLSCTSESQNRANENNISSGQCINVEDRLDTAQDGNGETNGQFDQEVISSGESNQEQWAEQLVQHHINANEEGNGEEELVAAPVVQVAVIPVVEEIAVGFQGMMLNQDAIVAAPQGFNQLPDCFYTPPKFLQARTPELDARKVNLKRKAATPICSNSQKAKKIKKKLGMEKLEETGAQGGAAGGDETGVDSDSSGNEADVDTNSDNSY